MSAVGRNAVGMGLAVPEDTRRASSGHVSVAKQKDPLWAVCMLAQLPAQARLSLVMCVQLSGEPRKVQLSSECS